MDDVLTYDIESERKVIKGILQQSDFSAGIMSNNSVAITHFTDLFHRDVLNVSIKYYRKYGTSPDAKKLKQYLPKYMTRAEKFKTLERQKEIWLKSVDRLFNPLTDEEKRGLKSDLDLLENLRKARLLQKALLEAERKYSEGNYEDAFKIFGRSITISQKIDSAATQGNIIDDLNQHILLDRQIKNGLFNPIQSFIPVVVERDGKYKIVYLDNFIVGGWYPGEMVLFVGEVNVGKSFLLMESAYAVSNFAKKNAIIFTIEMHKIKSERRIYSRATGIPYNKFKQGLLDKKDLEKLERWKNRWTDNGNGILEVVSFDNGCTVIDIENKTKDIENKYGEEFSLIAVDYINDMKAVGNYASDKNWEAMGEISWGLSNFAKYHNNHKGLAVISANQKKTSQYGKETTKAGSAAFSALPEHHATLGMGIAQNDADAIIGRVRLDLFKSRDGEKNLSFYMYPDFAKGKISSVNKAKIYYGNLDD